MLSDKPDIQIYAGVCALCVLSVILVALALFRQVWPAYSSVMNNADAINSMTMQSAAGAVASAILAFGLYRRNRFAAIAAVLAASAGFVYALLVAHAPFHGAQKGIGLISLSVFLGALGVFRHHYPRRGKKRD